MQLFLTRREIRDIERDRKAENGRRPLPDNLLCPQKVVAAYREIYGCAYVSSFRLSLNDGEHYVPLHVLVGGRLRGPGRSRITVLWDTSQEPQDHLEVVTKITGEMDRRYAALSKVSDRQREQLRRQRVARMRGD